MFYQHLGEIRKFHFFLAVNFLLKNDRLYPRNLRKETQDVVITARPEPKKIAAHDYLAESSIFTSPPASKEINDRSKSYRNRYYTSMELHKTATDELQEPQRVPHYVSPKVLDTQKLQQRLSSMTAMARYKSNRERRGWQVNRSLPAY